ncbi:hypothetical protein OOK13_06245 [Streptomyces sp. NBC_00378]|nr:MULTISPECIES: hypothetical protein [unclassified Streptomyces]MCX5108127.1 hypothetical protein [Streptomyces sp. NBC_00378]
MGNQEVARDGFAPVRDVFSSCSSVDSLTFSVFRFAVPGNRVAMRTRNRARASSIAFASRCRTTVVSIAVRLGSAARSGSGAFGPSACRAGAAVRFGGICDSLSRPS